MIPWTELFPIIKQTSTDSPEACRSEADVSSINEKLAVNDTTVFLIPPKPKAGGIRAGVLLVEASDGMYSLSYKSGTQLPRSSFRFRKSIDNPYSSIVLSINGYEFETKHLFLIDDVVGNREMFSKFENDCIAGAVYQAGMMADADMTQIVPESEIQEHFDLWRRTLGLHSAEETRNWMREQGFNVIKIRDYLLQKLFVAKVGQYFGEVAEYFVELRKARNSQVKIENDVDQPKLDESALVLAMKRLLLEHSQELSKDCLSEYFEARRNDFDEMDLVVFSNQDAEKAGKCFSVAHENPLSVSDLLSQLQEAKDFKVSRYYRADLPAEFQPEQCHVPYLVSFCENQVQKSAFVLNIQPANLDAGTKRRVLDAMYWDGLNNIKKVVQAELQLGSNKIFEQGGFVFLPTHQ